MNTIHVQDAEFEQILQDKEIANIFAVDPQFPGWRQLVARRWHDDLNRPDEDRHHVAYIDVRVDTVDAEQVNRLRQLCKAAGYQLAEEPFRTPFEQRRDAETPR